MFTLILFAPLFLLAQGELFDNRMSYTDGIYLSYDEFLQNKPSIPIEETQFKQRNTRFFNKLKINKLKVYQNGAWEKYELNQVWGICINGMPHIQYQVQQNKIMTFGNTSSTFHYDGDFTRIRIIGTICHFNVEDYYSSKKYIHTFSGYAPSGNGERISCQKMMKLESGVVCDFNEKNLGFLIQDDVELYEHYKTNTSKENLIFIYLQKYNERNPSYCYGN